MTEPRHTPELERWEVRTMSGGYKAIFCRGERITCDDMYLQLQDAQHIVACVNALAGLNPEGVADVVEALRALLSESDSPEEFNEAHNAARAALDKLEGKQ